MFFSRLIIPTERPHSFFYSSAFVVQVVVSECRGRSLVKAKLGHGPLPNPICEILTVHESLVLSYID
jgi:hypothetical protein